MTDIDRTLSAMGLSWPDPPRPVASYVAAARTGSLLFVSGQLPFREGRLTATGRVSSMVSVQEAQEAAAVCALNALAVVRTELKGDLSRLVRIVRVGVFVQSDEGFVDQPRVANGASDLLVRLLGDMGRHSRAAVGTYALPLAAAVEVELLAEIR
jgi:enamine deaminase RidA (YjgF/YER057c/UK114 family)